MEILVLLKDPDFYSIINCFQLPNFVTDILHQCVDILSPKAFDSIKCLKEFFGSNISLLPAAYSQVQITEAECKEIISTFGYLKA